jgi:hypothetical protein
MPTIEDMPVNRSLAEQWITKLSDDERQELIDQLIEVAHEVGDDDSFLYLKKHKYNLSDKELYQYCTGVRRLLQAEKFLNHSIDSAKRFMSRLWASMPSWNTKYQKM